MATEQSIDTETDTAEIHEDEKNCMQEIGKLDDDNGMNESSAIKLGEKILIGEESFKSNNNHVVEANRSETNGEEVDLNLETDISENGDEMETAISENEEEEVAMEVSGQGPFTDCTYTQVEPNEYDGMRELSINEKHQFPVSVNNLVGVSVVCEVGLELENMENGKKAEAVDTHLGSSSEELNNFGKEDFEVPVLSSHELYVTNELGSVLNSEEGDSNRIESAEDTQSNELNGTKFNLKDVPQFEDAVKPAEACEAEMDALKETESAAADSSAKVNNVGHTLLGHSKESEEATAYVKLTDKEMNKGSVVGDRTKEKKVIDDEQIVEEAFGQEQTGEETSDQEWTGEENVDQEQIDKETVDQEQIGEENVDQEHTGEENVDQEHTGEETVDQEWTGEGEEEEVGDEWTGEEVGDEWTGEEVGDEWTGEEVGDEWTGEEVGDEWTGEEVGDEWTGEEVGEECNGEGASMENADESLEVDETNVEVSIADASIMEISICHDTNPGEAELVDLAEDSLVDQDTLDNEMEIVKNASSANSSIAEKDTSATCLTEGNTELDLTNEITGTPIGIEEIGTGGEKQKIAENEKDETVLFTNSDIYLFNIPVGVKVEKAASWELANPTMNGTLKLLHSLPLSPNSTIKLEMRDEDGDLYGYAVINKYPGEMLRLTKDSKRYFLLKLTKINSYYSLPDTEETVGMAFPSREESFKFIGVLCKFLKAQSDLLSASVKKTIKRPVPVEYPIVKRPKVGSSSMESTRPPIAQKSAVKSPAKKKFVLTEENKDEFLKKGVDDGSGLFKCDECPPREGGIIVSFESMTEYKSHLFSIHKYRHVAHCVVCKMPFKTYVEMIEHRSQFHGFPCPNPDCDQVFKLSSQLTVHYLSKHATKLEFPCTLCQAKCPTRAALRIHVDDKHRNSDGSSILLDCPHVGCETKSFTEDELIGHVLCHQKNIKCQKCPEKFYKKSELRDHWKDAHGYEQQIRM